MSAAVKIMLVILSAVSVVHGYGYLDAHGNGTPIQGSGAVSVGMAGAGFTGFGDPASLLWNPSAISGIQGTSFSLSVGPGIGNESIIDSTGKHENTWITLGTMSAGMKADLGSIHIGAAMVRISDFSFNGTHLTFDYQPGHGDDISETRELTVTGGVYEAATGLSVRISPVLSVGGAVGYRFGGASFDSTFTDTQDPSNDTTVSWTEDIDGVAFHAGVQVPLRSTTLGASWSSSTDRVDSRAMAGGLFHIDDTGNTALGVEVSVTDPGGDNDFGLTGFGFASLSASVLIRGGFGIGFRNDESVKRDPNIRIAMGTSINLDRITLDFGCSWSGGGRESVILGGGVPDDISESNAVVAFGIGWTP